MGQQLGALWNSLTSNDRRTIEDTLGITLDDYTTPEERATVLVEFYTAAKHEVEQREKRELIDFFFSRLEQSALDVAELLEQDTNAHGRRFGLVDQLGGELRHALQTRPPYLLPDSTPRDSLPVLQNHYSEPATVHVNRSENFRCPYGADVDVRSEIIEGLRYDQCTLAQNVRDSRTIFKIVAMKRADCPKASYLLEKRCIYVTGEKVMAPNG